MSTYTIATGRWNDYSNSGGLTDSLTLSVQTSALLIAATATFITIVGARFWSILSFSIFQIRASPYDKDGIHHQQQTIYRTNSQLGTVWILMRIVWSWRNNSRRNILRFIIFALPPLLSFAAFTAAGIMSSRIAAPNYSASQVRIEPRNCGLIVWHQTSDPVTIELGTIQYSTRAVAKARLATDYARRCYTDAASTPAGCRLYPSQQLPYKIETTAPCPFAGGRCWLGEEGAMRMRTEWLDSHTHLGINAQLQNRIRFQRVTTCSVLKVDDLVSAHRQDGTDIYHYFLGPQGAKGSVNRINETHGYRESSQWSQFGYSIL